MQLINTTLCLHFNKSIITSTPIEYEVCENKFPNVDKSLYDRIGLLTYIWPKNTNFYISGNFNSLNFEVIQISLSKWTGLNCKSDDVINQVVINNYIDLQIMSAYFDFNDFSNPVKPYLDDLSYISIMKDNEAFITYKVKVNEVYDNSNIIFGTQAFSSNYNFYSIDKIETSLQNFSSTKNSYAVINISLDQKINQYFRSSYSFWDMLGYMGGIYGLLKAFGYLMFSFITKRQFYSSVLSELYHVETECKDNKDEENNKKQQNNLSKINTKCKSNQIFNNLTPIK